jgi:alanine racemase
VLSIDLGALQQNYLTLRKQVAPSDCGASVKANAYGIGMEAAAKALQAAGCRTYFVALPEEGKRLRGILDNAHIYVLGGLFRGEARFYSDHRLRPVLNQLDEIDEWAGWCSETRRKLPAAIHIESGINRLGLGESDIQRLAQRSDVFARFELALVMSHLAKADEPDDEFNRWQLERFNKMRRLLPDALASLANTPGAFLPSAYHFDLVRPGIGLYGGNPFSDRPSVFRPVVQLHARVLQVKSTAAGENVGYGGTWRAKRETLVAVVAAGYGDGYPRQCSSSREGGPASVWVKGKFAPLIGRVSMDMITVDVTDIAEQIGRGDMVELMGMHVTVDNLARWAGTIPYEILTRLGSRYPRLYSAFDS